MGKATLSIVTAFLLVSGSAYGQANLTFSGGSGSPFSLTLTQPVVYTLTTGFPSSSGPGFVFQNVGNVIAGGPIGVTGTITFTINGGADQLINFINSGVTAGAITPNDVYIFGAEPAANAGDVIRLNAGTLTTGSNISAAAPPDGPYATFVVAGGARVSPDGLAVPEPQSAALFAMGVLGLFSILRLARRA